MTTPAPAFWLARPQLPALEIGHLLGYSTVLLDMEHGALTSEACDAHVSLAKALGMESIIRVADAQRILVQQALDYGADAVMLPMIQNVAHADHVAGYAKYPPMGTRGVGSGRSFGYGSYTSLDDNFHTRANATSRCYIMIETEAALTDVHKIAALPHVDGLFIGPSDLSLARGRGAFRFTMADETDFTRVADACHHFGKKLGLPAPTPKAMALAKQLKADFLTISDDLTALRVGMDLAITTLRKQSSTASDN